MPARPSRSGSRTASSWTGSHDPEPAHPSAGRRGRRRAGSDADDLPRTRDPRQHRDPALEQSPHGPGKQLHTDHADEILVEQSRLDCYYFCVEARYPTIELRTTTFRAEHENPADDHALFRRARLRIRPAPARRHDPGQSGRAGVGLAAPELRRDQPLDPRRLSDAPRLVLHRVDGRRHAGAVADLLRPGAAVGNLREPVARAGRGATGPRAAVAARTLPRAGVQRTQVAHTVIGPAWSLLRPAAAPEPNLREAGCRNVRHLSSGRVSR